MSVTVIHIAANSGHDCRRSRNRRGTGVRLILAVALSAMAVAAPYTPCLAAEDDAIVIGVPVDRCPMFYEDSETGTVTGIGTDLMSAAAEEAGFSVRFETISGGTLKDALDSDAYDAIMPLGSAITSSSGTSSVVSENLMQTPFALVTQGRSHKRLPPLGEMRIGMLSSLGGGAETVRQLYPGVDISLYESMPECVRALRSGEVDALLHNSYVWSYVLQKPAYSDLSVQPSTVFSMDFRAGAPDTPEGRKTIARLDEGIRQIEDTRRQAIVLDHTSRQLYKYDFEDYVRQYALPVSVMILIMVLLIVLAILHHRMTKLRHEEKIRKILDRDELTTALSLNGFRKRVIALLQEHPEIPYTMVYSNIRDFKYVNDKLGRKAGDDLLRFWAEVLDDYLSDDECLGRFDGDHFVVLCKASPDEKVARDEQMLVDKVRNYFLHQGGDNRLQVCSGIYVLETKDYAEPNVDRMIDFAREAESHARADKGDGYALYNIDQWERGKRAADIVGHLPVAIEKNEIQVWYQPQVDRKTGRVTGAEALCRWEHPKLGWVSPGEFIPLLEDANLIYMLDRYIWTRVCCDLRRWNEQGHRRVVSVNVSRHDMEENNRLPQYMLDLAASHGVDPQQLHVEITETAYADHPETLVKATEEFQGLGFRVEMDDFGSGYSSLNMLKEILVDRVKLDLRFLTESGDPERGRIIISHVIRMVNELGMELIAEGVETTEQADFLMARGCSEMQGYRFHRPMCVTDFEALEEAEEERTANCG